MNISSFLKIKSRPVVTIGPEETLSAAIKKLVENSIGTLPVCDDKGTLLGIISERDLLKEVFLHDNAIGNSEVKNVMTKDVIIATPEDDLDYAISVMRRQGISQYSPYQLVLG